MVKRRGESASTLLSLSFVIALARAFGRRNDSRIAKRRERENKRKQREREKKVEISEFGTKSSRNGVDRQQKESDRRREHRKTEVL